MLSHFARQGILTPDRSMSLGSLAVGLTTRYNLLGGVDGLNEAVPARIASLRSPTPLEMLSHFARQGILIGLCL